MKKEVVSCWFMLLFLLGNFSFGQETNDSMMELAAINVFDDPDRAIELGQKIYQSNEGNPKVQINALLLLSNAYSSKIDYTKAIETELLALKLSREINDQKMQVFVLSTIANQYSVLGVYNKSLQYLDEADLVAEKYPQKDSIRMILGNNFAVRGTIYKEQLSCEIAIEYFDKALLEYKKSKSNSKILANSSLTEYLKGSCYVSLKSSDSATVSFDRAYKIAEDIGSENLKGYAINGRAEVNMLQGNYESAIIELKNIIDKTNQAEEDLELGRMVYSNIANSFLAIKDWENYRKYYAMFLNVEQKTIIAKRNSLSKSLSKSREEVEKKISENNFIFYGILSALAITFIAFIYFFVRDYKKNNRDLKVLLSDFDKK